MREKKKAGIRLLKKGKRGLFTIVFSRLGIVLVLFFAQIFLVLSFFSWFQDFLPQIYGIAIIFSVSMVLYLLNSSYEASGKVTWLIMIMLFPIFGSLFFLFTKTNLGHRKIKEATLNITNKTRDMIPQDEEVFDSLNMTNPAIASLSKYIASSGCFPVYKNTLVKFFPLGEDKLKELLIQLEKAKSFIFLEYFIISEGIMWGQILKILVRKASEGVDVRVMYDGTCEFLHLSPDYSTKLNNLGIKCKVFAPITPFLSTHYNYRDHRKILIIDGKVAFNGGINLADEYINIGSNFGHWKDSAVMIEGDAVKSFTLMFLQMWSLKEEKLDIERFLNYSSNPSVNAKGFVLPYADSPLDDERVGEQVYIDILNRARKYVYIMTPYLIIDGELESTLKYAAKRGVEIRILLPAIPDKKSTHALAFTHYKSLLSAGVKIYEYTPGFVHSKCFIADDIEAVVGTINLDYRSLYHNFECATYMYDVDCIKDIEKNFIDAFDLSRKITLESLKDEKLSRKALGYAIKAISPLL